MRHHQHQAHQQHTDSLQIIQQFWLQLLQPPNWKCLPSGKASWLTNAQISALKLLRRHLSTVYLANSYTNKNYLSTISVVVEHNSMERGGSEMIEIRSTIVCMLENISTPGFLVLVWHVSAMRAKFWNFVLQSSGIVFMWVEQKSRSCCSTVWLFWLCKPSIIDGRSVQKRATRG